MLDDESKVVVLGSQGVGKTSVILRYCSGSFARHMSPTIGASFFTCNVPVGYSFVKLQIWDTAGQERFRSMAPMYYRNADAAILMFDITRYETFAVMKSWAAELKRNIEEAIVLCVVGNKCDLRSAREVQIEDALKYASSIGALFFETSAISNEGVEQAFAALSQDVFKAQQKKKTMDVTNSCFKSENISLKSSKKIKTDCSEETSFLCC